MKIYLRLMLMGAVVAAAWKPLGEAGRPIQDRKDFSRLKALAGTWERKTVSGFGYEDWVLGPDGNLKGREYRVEGADTIVRERVNLSRKQQQVVYAVTGTDPKNPLPVAFFLVEAGKDKFVFANPTHDYPKRIVYRFLTADSLHAWIDGGEKEPENRVDFYYRRVK